MKRLFALALLLAACAAPPPAPAPTPPPPASAPRPQPQPSAPAETPIGSGRVNASTLLFPPGARFSYSNIGYLFVRQIIERAAGTDLNAAVKTLVSLSFRPGGWHFLYGVLSTRT